MGEYIKWFSEITKDDTAVAGGKGANLGVMYSIKLPVPPGFVITAQAYKYFTESTGIQNKILSILENLDVELTLNGILLSLYIFSIGLIKDKTSVGGFVILQFSFALYS